MNHEHEPCTHCGEPVTTGTQFGIKSDDGYDFLECCSQNCADALVAFYTEEMRLQDEADARKSSTI